MEDFLKYLFMLAIIIVAIIKEVNKSNKSKKANNKRPAHPTPPPVEVAPDATPIPDFWGRGLPLDEWLQPKPAEQPATKPAAKQKKKKKKEEISVAASLANSSAQDERNARQGSHYSLPDTSEHEQDYTIHSAEEARRAIIWGEILQRKY